MGLCIYTYFKASVNECLFYKQDNLIFFFFFPLFCLCFRTLGSGLHFDSTVPSSDYSHGAGETLLRKIGGKSRSHWLQGQMVHNSKKAALWKVE